MNDPIKDQVGAAEAQQTTENIDKELEALGPAPAAANRQKRRTHIGKLRHLALDPGVDSRLFQAMHPGRLTKQGKIRLEKRRAKAKAAKKARKGNR